VFEDEPFPLKVHDWLLVKNIESPGCRASETVDPRFFCSQSQVEGSFAVWRDPNEVEDVNRYVQGTPVVFS